MDLPYVPTLIAKTASFQPLATVTLRTGHENFQSVVDQHRKNIMAKV